MTNDDVALTGNIDRESCFLDRWMRISNERKTASTELSACKRDVQISEPSLHVRPKSQTPNVRHRQ